MENDANRDEYGDDFSHVTPKDHEMVRLSKVRPELAEKIRQMADAGYFPLYPIRGEVVVSWEDVNTFLIGVGPSSWED